MRLLAKVIGVLQLSPWFVLASVATFFKNRECPTRVFRGIWRARARHTDVIWRHTSPTICSTEACVNVPGLRLGGLFTRSATPLCQRKYSFFAFLDAERTILLYAS